MRSELTSYYHFYGGPYFTEQSFGPYEPRKEYELREDYMISGGCIVSSRRVGFLTGDVVQRMIDLKRFFLDLRLPEPKGVISIREMVDWVNKQL